MSSTVSRLDALRIFAVAGAGFSLGMDVLGSPSIASAATGVAAGANATDFSPLVWLKMHDDGKTTVVLNHIEMGQGTTTGLPMMLADELDIPFSTVSYELCPVTPAYYSPFWKGIFTAGSKSTPTMGPVMRKAGATARLMLVNAAAQQWKVDPSTCVTSNGYVTGPNGQRAAYTTLFATAATLPVPTDVVLKTPDQYKIMGRRQARLDVLPKTNGTAMYGMDVRVPGMKYASIEKPLQIGATVKSFDATEALKFPGVRKVVQVSSGVAVIADNTYSAFHGRTLLKVAYADGPNAHVSTEGIYAEGNALVKKDGLPMRTTGDTAAALQAGKTITAVYETPYLAHATMEPMNATADVRADGVTLWLPTQAQTPSQAVAAKIAGVPLDKVIVHTTFLGGGFGRRGEVDFAQDAVEVSKAAGMPIKVVWTREDDIRNDQYRGGTINALAGAIGADGSLTALKQVMASSSINARTAPARIRKDGLDPDANRGISDLPYLIPNQLTSWHELSTKIDVGHWRAPYYNSSTFPTESFIDELAHAAGKDPIAFRLAMLKPGEPPRQVLEKVAQLAKWGAPLPAGHAHGVALGQYDDAWVATVAEVSITNGKLTVHKLNVAVDVGQPVNLETLDQQVPSAAIYAMSAAIRGKITFKDGVPVQKNFPDYPVVHMENSPEFVIDIARATRPSTGAGEIGVPTTAPAITNAIFALTGKRIRKLPISDALA
jgi:isoquinoline 1-oxidoreductase beta subunit